MSTQVSTNQVMNRAGFIAKYGYDPLANDPLLANGGKWGGAGIFDNAGQKQANKPAVPTNKPTVPTNKPAVPTNKPAVPTNKPNVPVNKPTGPMNRARFIAQYGYDPLANDPLLANGGRWGGAGIFDNPGQKPTDKPQVPTNKPEVPSNTDLTDRIRRGKAEKRRIEQIFRQKPEFSPEAIDSRLGITPAPSALEHAQKQKMYEELFGKVDDVQDEAQRVINNITNNNRRINNITQIVQVNNTKI